MIQQGLCTYCAVLAVRPFSAGSKPEPTNLGLTPGGPAARCVAFDKLLEHSGPRSSMHSFHFSYFSGPVVGTQDAEGGMEKAPVLRGLPATVVYRHGRTKH